MQKKLIVLLLTLFLLSCKDDNKRAIENKQAVTEKDTITSKLNIETPESVAFNFYKWYLKDIYLKKNVESPEVKLNKDSIYVLDTQKHKKFIEENSFFSKSFMTTKNLHLEIAKKS